MKIKSLIKEYGMPLLGVLLLSAFPAFFMFCANAGEASFSEAIEPLLVFLALGGGLYAVLCLISRSSGRSAIAAGIFMLLFTNFSFAEKFLKLFSPNMKYWHSLPIIVVLAIIGMLAVMMLVPKEAARSFSLVLCFVYGGLTVVNAVTAVPGIASRLQTRQELSAAAQEKNAGGTAAADSPNVYWIIFDEYCGFNQIRDYYHYDNAVLENFLLDNNFTISYNSHNESIVTTTILTNAVNLDYVVDNTTDESRKELLRKQGRFFEMINEHGYDLQIIQSEPFFSDNSVDEKSEAVTASGENLTYLIYHNTLLYPFITLNTIKAFENTMAVLDTLSSKDIVKQTPTFTIGYTNFPHTPFVVDETGEAVPVYQNDNWKDAKYYLGQYKYATDQMIRIVKNIVNYDPGAVIILQSDHGARASTDNTLFLEWFPLEAMNNPLNCVYYRGEEIPEIIDQSTVNTLRTVMSMVWNEDYGIIPVPEDNYNYK